MAKKKPAEQEPDKKPKRHQVILDADLARMVGVIASALDMSVPDWVNSRLKPLAEKELPLAMDMMGLTVQPKK